MPGWSREEVESTVADYLSMLASHLSGTPYNKTVHRQALQPLLNGRSEQAVEFKHANISAALIDLGYPYIPGYKPRSNYQRLLADVIVDRLMRDRELLSLIAADADRPLAVPEVDDILSVLTAPPQRATQRERTVTGRDADKPEPANYLEREARNRSLGLAGEKFVINYERARLISCGAERLAAKIEHTSRMRGDHEGYDVLSYETSGAERLIEVKATKHGSFTPFFVTQNEVTVSERHAEQYQLYRLYTFGTSPKLFTLSGAISRTCELSASTYRARAR